MDLYNTKIFDKPEEDIEEINLLVSIIDVNSLEWGRQKALNSGFSFESFMNQVLVFLKFYLYTSPTNQIALMTYCDSPNRFLFPKKSKKEKEGKRKKRKRFKDMEIDFEAIKSTILTSLKTLVKSLDDKKSESNLAGVLSHALCYINGCVSRNPHKKVNSRIVVFQISTDVIKQYRNVMNCMFCSKTLNVLVDSCIIGDLDSTFLQQVSSYTGGIYHKPPEKKALLQYLLQMYSIDGKMRKTVCLPDQNITDFRVTAEDTNKKIDQGYVCSECLTIYSKKMFICTKCGVRFFTKFVKKKRKVGTEKVVLKKGKK